MGYVLSCIQCIIYIVSMRETNLRNLDLNLLVLLDALIEHRNVTRAAAVAHLSQPAMSRALSRLRAMLDDPLLVRGPEGLAPTSRAAALHPRLKAILAEVRNLVAASPFTPHEFSGELTLAATDHQTIMLLPHLMARLSREAPNVNVTVVPFLASTVEQLGQGKVDLAFGVIEPSLPAYIHRQGLYRDQFVTLLRQNHPALSRWSLDIFLSLEHVLVTILGDGRGAVDAVLDTMNLSRRIALRLPHFYAAIAIIAQSDLVVTVPASIAQRYAKAYGLRILKLPVEVPSFTVASLWSDIVDSDPVNIWLRHLIREEAERVEGINPL
jgi:DNA-binding transcriptional LysR family regulator